MNTNLTEFSMNIFNNLKGINKIGDIMITFNDYIPNNYNNGIINISLRDIKNISNNDINEIKKNIIDSIIHELFHSVQILDMNRYNIDIKYRNDKEAEVISSTSNFIISNIDYFKTIFNIDFSNKLNYYNSICNLRPIELIENNIEEYYELNIGKITYTDVNTIIIVDRFQNANYIKYNNRYIKENLKSAYNFFNNLGCCKLDFNNDTLIIYTI